MMLKSHMTWRKYQITHQFCFPSFSDSEKRERKKGRRTNEVGRKERTKGKKRRKEDRKRRKKRRKVGT